MIMIDFTWLHKWLYWLSQENFVAFVLLGVLAINIVVGSIIYAIYTNKQEKIINNFDESEKKFINGIDR